MKRKNEYGLAVLVTSVVFATVFQNCSKATFIGGSDSSAISTTSPGSETDLASASSGIGGAVTGTSSKLKVCDDNLCVDSGDQKIYFNNSIGVSLKVTFNKIISNSSIVVTVSNEFNPAAIRKTNVRLDLKSNGYVLMTHEDPNKPWLCLDPQQSSGSTIGGAINCSSPLVMTGTKQKYFQIAQTYPGAAGTSTIDQIKANGSCPAESCLNLPNSHSKLVLNDLAGTSSGLKIDSIFKLQGQDRYKLIISDMEGRKNTMLVTDPTAGNFSVLDHVTLFDQNDHGYLCFEPKSGGLAVVKQPSGKQGLNCFSSVRYSVLNSGNTVSVSGSIPFLNIKGQPANTSLMSVGDDRYFTTIYKETP